MTKSSLLEKIPDNNTPQSALSSFADSLPDAKIIIKSNCKLCNSSNRADAENEYEKQNYNVQAVLNFLIKKGENITYNAVQRHLERHYLAQERNIRLKEYAEDLAPILRSRQERRVQLSERVAILEKQLWSLSMELETADLDQKIKGTAAVKQLSDTIASHEAEIYNIDKEAEPIALLMNNLRTIISDEVKKTKNEETKTVLVGLFDKLAASVSGVLVEKKQGR